MTEQVQAQVGVGRASRWQGQVDDRLRDLGGDAARGIVGTVGTQHRLRCRSSRWGAQLWFGEPGVQYLTGLMHADQTPTPGRGGLIGGGGGFAVVHGLHSSWPPRTGEQGDPGAWTRARHWTLLSFLDNIEKR